MPNPPNTLSEYTVPEINREENGAPNGENPAENGAPGRHFMCTENGGVSASGSLQQSAAQSPSGSTQLMPGAAGRSAAGSAPSACPRVASPARPPRQPEGNTRRRAAPAPAAHVDAAEPVDRPAPEARWDPASLVATRSPSGSVQADTAGSPLGFAAADVQDPRSATADVQEPGSATPTPPVAAPTPPRTRLQKGVINRINYKNISKYGLTCLSSESGEPKTLGETLGDAKWKKAMEEEYTALLRNQDVALSSSSGRYKFN